MRNIRTLGFIGIFLLFGGCATHSATNDEKVDLYLSTLDDKHFVWCQLDLEQCRQDFEEWKLSARGQMIMKEFEKEDTTQTYNTHHVPNVFRTRFVDENQLAEESGEQDALQDLGQGFKKFNKTFYSIEENPSLGLDGIRMSTEIYGPEVSSDVQTHADVNHHMTK